MIFQSRNTIPRTNSFPPGYYFKQDKRWCLIEELTFNPYGEVLFKWKNPLAPAENGWIKICDLEELINTLPNTEFARK